jgi:hypothetical protein
MARGEVEVSVCVVGAVSQQTERQLCLGALLRVWMVVRDCSGLRAGHIGNRAGSKSVELERASPLSHRHGLLLDPLTPFWCSSSRSRLRYSPDIISQGPEANQNRRNRLSQTARNTEPSVHMPTSPPQCEPINRSTLNRIVSIYS